METTPARWPAYLTGPDDSLFAVGVAAAKYAELEPVFWLMFSAIFGLQKEAARMICSKLGVEASRQLAGAQLINIQWSQEVKTPVEHFLTAFGICAGNRNNLVHSEFSISENPELFHTSKQGKLHVSLPTIDELRAVADDMHKYISFGKDLANTILNTVSDPRPQLDGAAHPSPDIPPLPRVLPYTQVHPDQ